VRRFKVLLAVLAVMVMMLANAAPAMADGWWENCEWNFSPWWGWFLTCDWNPGSSWDSGWDWGHGWGDDDGWDDDGWEPGREH
jgi:hypothetical protein